MIFALVDFILSDDAPAFGIAIGIVVTDSPLFEDILTSNPVPLFIIGATFEAEFAITDGEVGIGDVAVDVILG